MLFISERRELEFMNPKAIQNEKPVSSVGIAVTCSLDGQRSFPDRVKRDF
jgi:hypothetical protein